MDAEQIVRALAASDPVGFDNQEEPACTLCEAALWNRMPQPLDDPATHDPNCPWRLAREWVAQAGQPASVS